MHLAEIRLGCANDTVARSASLIFPLILSRRERRLSRRAIVLFPRYGAIEFRENDATTIRDNYR